MSRNGVSKSSQRAPQPSALEPEPMHVPVGPAHRHGPTPTTVIDSSEDSAERSRVVIVLDVDDDAADVRHGVVIIDLC